MKKYYVDSSGYVWTRPNGDDVLVTTDEDLALEIAELMEDLYQRALLEYLAIEEEGY